MAIKVGAKVSGKVTGITNFGAFVKLENGKTGLVHISEISYKFIKNIHDVLKVGDTVTVKVLRIGNDGKISLSMKQAEPASVREKYFKNRRRFHRNHYHRGGRYHGHGHYHGRRNYHRKPNFHDLMSNFLKQSQSRMSVLKKNTEGKRGGRGGRRS